MMQDDCKKLYDLGFHIISRDQSYKIFFIVIDAIILLHIVYICLSFLAFYN
jgi:hypothetical protein